MKFLRYKSKDRIRTHILPLPSGTTSPFGRHGEAVVAIFIAPCLIDNASITLLHQGELIELVVHPNPGLMALGVTGNKGYLILPLFRQDVLMNKLAVLIEL